MRFGKRLDQQVELFSLAVVNTLGQVEKTYSTEGTVWADVIGAKGSEAIDAARQDAKEAIRVLLRFRSDVDTKWRMIWEGTTYNIVHVDKTNRRQGELWLTCQSVGRE